MLSSSGWALNTEMRVLLVEDEVQIADFVTRGLAEQGYAVDVAYDGDEALPSSSTGSL